MNKNIKIILFIIIFVILIIPDFSPVRRFGDVSTYFMEIDSIAHDHDIRYEKIDIERAFKNQFDDLPAGLMLLKNGSGDLFYGKEFTYPFAASFFYELLGKNGILVFNSIMAFIMIYIGYIYLRFNNPDVVSLLIAALFFLLSTAYLYIYWVMADIYNMFLISLGLFLWLSYLNRIDNGIEDGRPHLFLYSSALICGLATFAKAPNFVCLLPLLIFEAHFRSYKHIAKILAIYLFTIFILFGTNYIITGNLTSYGLQYYYVSKYPFWEGCAANCSLPPEGVKVIGEQIKPSILGFYGLKTIGYNVFYYLFGRFTGVIWYYPPILLSIFSILTLLYDYIFNNKKINASTKHSNLNFGRLLLPISITIYIFTYLYLDYANWAINYFGGQDTVRNRYFYIYPMFLFLIGKIEFTKRTAIIFSSIMLISLAFVLPLIASPIATLVSPMEHATHLPYRVLPLEYTALDDLPLYNPPPAVLDDVKFYFMQPNIKTVNNTLVIEGSYQGLLFKADAMASYIPCILNPSESKNLTLESGGITKRITLGKNQQVLIEMPIEPVFQLNEKESIYKLDVSIAQDSSSNKSIIMKLIDNSKYMNFNYLGGWNDNEAWNGKPFRWMVDNSTLSVYSDKDNLAGLSLQTISFWRPRTLEIYVNGIKSKTIPAILPEDFTTIVDQVRVKKGTNLIQFRVPEGCEQPHDISSKNPDNRCLSIGFQKITIRDLAS